MYTFKLVFSNLYRNRGRYLLFGVLVVILSTAWLICLLLGDAAVALQTELMDTYGTAVVLRDVTSARYVMKVEDYEQFNDPAWVDRIEPTAYTQAEIYGKLSFHDSDGQLLESNYYTYHVVGMKFDSTYTPFTQPFGGYTMVRGRTVEADDECIIFEDYYEKLLDRKLITGLGDTILIEICTFDWEKIKNYPQLLFSMKPISSHPMKIVGTVDRESTNVYPYQIKTYQMENSKTGELHTTHEAPYVFFISFEKAKQFNGIDANAGEQVETIKGNPRYSLYSKYDMVFHLRDYASLEGFRAMIQQFNDDTAQARLLADFTRDNQKGSIASWDDYRTTPVPRPELPFYHVEFYLDGFEEMIKPLDQVGRYTKVISINLTVMIGVLFILLTVLNLYARIDEIGILRCIGMPKRNISFTFLAEQTIFLFIALTLGIGGGVLLLNQLIEQPFIAQYHYEFSDMLQMLPTTMGVIYSVGFALCLLACFGGAVYIQQYRPLKILRNRC